MYALRTVIYSPYAPFPTGVCDDGWIPPSQRRDARPGASAGCPLAAKTSWSPTSAQGQQQRSPGIQGRHGPAGRADSRRSDIDRRGDGAMVEHCRSDGRAHGRPGRRPRRLTPRPFRRAQSHSMVLGGPRVSMLCETQLFFAVCSDYPSPLYAADARVVVAWLA